MLQDLLARADVQLNGSRPWDIQVHDKHMYERVFASWSLGLGESYMDGEWDCDALDELFTRLLRADLGSAAMGIARVKLIAEHLRHKLFNLQSKSRAFEVGEQHYDAGNDVFEAMLDSRMIYSCAYWENAATLEEAQYAKLDMICRKLRLKPGETLLDIGCGWGGLAKFAAENYGVKVTGVTVSRNSWRWRSSACGPAGGTAAAGLPRPAGQLRQGRVGGHVRARGPEELRHLLHQRAAADGPEGIFLLHTIGIAATSQSTDPWIDRYVFPNGKLPSAVEISTAVEGRFIIEDWHNFGADYDRTLMAWWDRFQRAWPRLEERYGKRFYRMWQYYLMCCAGFFRSREGQLWQVILTHPQRGDTYRSLR